LFRFLKCVVSHTTASIIYKAKGATDLPAELVTAF
jgi:hypothetical protein